MSVYRVTEVIGTSGTSWEERRQRRRSRRQPGQSAIFGVAEVVKLDIHVDEGGAVTYRAKIQLSFKYEPEH